MTDTCLAPGPSFSIANFPSLISPTVITLNSTNLLNWTFLGQLAVERDGTRDCDSRQGVDPEEPESQPAGTRARSVAMSPNLCLEGFISDRPERLVNNQMAGTADPGKRTTVHCRGLGGRSINRIGGTGDTQ